MKNILFSAAFAMTFCYASAQKLKETEVPTVVKTKFTSMHPAIQKVEWGKEGGNYEAEYDTNKVENSVTFDGSGNVVETETGIAPANLPPAARKYLADNHPGKKVSEASEVLGADGTVTYEAEIKGVDYVFDENGKFIRTKKD